MLLLEPLSEQDTRLVLEIGFEPVHLKKKKKFNKNIFKICKGRGVKGRTVINNDDGGGLSDDTERWRRRRLKVLGRSQVLVGRRFGRTGRRTAWFQTAG